MEYQKIINLLDNTTNQPSKFGTRNWVEINDESRGKYDISNTEFKTSMIKSDLYDYSDAYIVVSETIAITGAGGTDERNKGVIIKNCAPFTKCISSINNIQIDNAEYIDVVMPMYNLIEYSDNYSKTSRSQWQCSRDDPNDNITQSESFKYKIKITGKAPAAGNTKDVKIAVPLKYLSNFWRTLEMPLINCEISPNLTWSKKCVIFSAVGVTEFKITDTNLGVPIITLSTEDRVKLFKQLESGFKRTTNWNKYHPKFKTFPQNRYSNYLIDPSFQGVNRLFVLPFENQTDRGVRTKYYLPTEEIKDYNVII